MSLITDGPFISYQETKQINKLTHAPRFKEAWSAFNNVHKN